MRRMRSKLMVAALAFLSVFGVVAPASAEPERFCHPHCQCGCNDYGGCARCPPPPQAAVTLADIIPNQPEEANSCQTVEAAKAP